MVIELWPGASPGAAGRTVAWLAKVVERALDSIDLSLAQYRVLSLVGDGTEAASALAERLAVRRPSVTAVVDGLVGRGLLERLPVAGDRRRASLSLTDAGWALLEQADQAVDRRLACILDVFDEPDAPRAAGEGLRTWSEALSRSLRVARVKSPLIEPVDEVTR